MSEENTRLNEFTDADSDKPDRSQRLENKIDIIKGTKPDEVLDERSDGAEKYLVVDTLTGEDEKYAIDESAPSAKPRDSIMIIDGSKSGRVYSGDSGILGSTMASLRPDGINPTFLYYFLESNFNRINSATKGSAVPHTDKDLVRSLEYGINSFSEQQKIATVLHTVDQAIQKTENVIDRYQRVKRGVRQDLLETGLDEHNLIQTNSRFGEIPANWSLERLVDITDIVGRTEPPTDVDKYWDGDIPWATPGDIRSLDSPIISETEQTVTKTALDEVSSNLVPPNSVLLTTRATVGLCAVNKIELTTSRAFKNLIPGKEINTWYLYYRIESMEDYLNRLGWGSTFTEVIKPVLKNVLIPVPPLEEQREIGKLLRSIDEVISHNIDIYQEYETFKQGLMQDLLSGEVRTTDTDIDIPEEVAKYG